MSIHDIRFWIITVLPVIVAVAFGRMNLVRLVCVSYCIVLAILGFLSIALAQRGAEVANESLDRALRPGFHEGAIAAVKWISGTAVPIFLAAIIALAVLAAFPARRRDVQPVARPAGVPPPVS
jgi:hypothetical protein